MPSFQEVHQTNEKLFHTSYHQKADREHQPRAFTPAKTQASRCVQIYDTRKSRIVFERGGNHGRAV